MQSVEQSASQLFSAQILRFIENLALEPRPYNGLLSNHLGLLTFSVAKIKSAISEAFPQGSATTNNYKTITGC